MGKKSKMMRISENGRGDTIALYVRVSTDKQREEGYSIDVQKERLQGYMKSKGTKEKSQLYIDDGYTGATLSRPAMSKLLDDVKDGKISSVVVVKLDRLSRSQKDTLYLIEDVFMPHGVAFASLNESFDTSTPFGRAMVGILSVFAQLERENIFERTRSGMQKRVESGLWMGGGRVPFGYDYDKDQGILVPNKDAETVRTIYDLYIKGYALQTIANMCGLKYEKLARQIITRKSNAGYIVYNGVEYKGQHDPIVGLETYNKAMMIMLERSKKYVISDSHHLLTGLVYCGKCGAKMRYQNWGKNKYKLICYSQQKSKPYLVKDPNCDNKRVDANIIDEIVLRTVFKACKKKVDTENTSDHPKSPVEILNAQHKTCNKKLKRLYMLFSEDADEALIDTIVEIKRQMEVLNKQIEIAKQDEMVTQRARDVVEHIENIETLWEYSTIQEQRNAIRSLVKSVIITDNDVKVNLTF